jgi:hypothetical protein
MMSVVRSLLNLVKRPGRGTLKAVGVCLISAVIYDTALQAFDGPQRLTSSVMWQTSEKPDERFVYPPGVPAVLRPSNEDRTLRIEQYFSHPISADSIAIDLHGTWPETPENALKANSNGGWTGRFVSISAPACDDTKTLGGFRCFMDVNVSPSTPSGTIGLSTRLNIFGRNYGHQNGVFWIILPEMSAPHFERPFLSNALPAPIKASLNRTEESPYPALSVFNRERAKRATVQITLEGNFSLGSGFLVSNAETIFPVFGSEMSEKLRALPANTRFVVTAAHLFPLGYGFAPRGQIQNILDNAESLFDDGETCLGEVYCGVDSLQFEFD